MSSVFIPQKLTTVFSVAPQTLTLNINFVSRSLKHSFIIRNLPITPYEESGSQEETALSLIGEVETTPGEIDTAVTGSLYTRQPVP